MVHPAAPIRILLVDDEETIHRALDRTLRREPYEILHAYDSAEAAAILDAHPEVRAVVCDHYMPGLPGLDFLLHLRRKRPDLIAILLTAQADLALVIAAINEGHLHRFITKPWDADELRRSLRVLLGLEVVPLDDARRKLEQEEARIRRQLVPMQDADGAFLIEPPEGS